jgi:hypothetical protein
MSASAARPTTEEELRAVTVGELRPLPGPILLADYDPNWLAQFEREAKRISAVLGPGAADRARRLYRDPRPGRQAIIDILLVVEDATD